MEWVAGYKAEITSDSDRICYYHLCHCLTDSVVLTLYCHFLDKMMPEQECAIPVEPVVNPPILGVTPTF